MMIKHVAFFVYPVTDIERARQFYEGILGLKLTHDYEGHWLEYSIQDVTLAITDWMEDAKPCHTGPCLALEVAHADTNFQFMRDNGVKILKELFDTPVCRMGMIADPDGNGILIHQAKTAQ